MGTCAVCGDELPDARLLFGATGPTCAPCLQRAEAAVQTREGDMRAILGPPLLVVAALIAYCVPFVGPVVGLICALAAMGTGFMAIQRWRGMADDPDHDPSRRQLVLISGIVAGVLGLGEVVVGMGIAVATVVALMGTL